MTAALEGGEWSAAHPSCTLPPGKTWYPFYRRLGGPWGRSGQAESLIPTGIRSRTIQPVAVAIPTELPGPLRKLCKWLVKEDMAWQSCDMFSGWDSALRKLQKRCMQNCELVDLHE